MHSNNHILIYHLYPTCLSTLGAPSLVKQTQNLMFILILAYKHSTLRDEGTIMSRFPHL
jgi:hypothetical protein